MKPRGWILALISLLALLVGAGYLLVQKLMSPDAGSVVPDSVALEPARVQLADRFIDLLDDGEWDTALGMTTPKVRDGLGGGKLEKTWASLAQQLGERRARAAARGEAIDGAPIVTIALEYSMMTLDARVVFDVDDRISGFWIVPAKSAASAPARLQSNERFAEHDFSVGEGARALPGSLTLPAVEGPFAAVVLVHGSGPNDRDETLGPNKPFRDLAHALAERGIASLRYDKRTRVHPSEFSGAFTVDDETTDDAVAAIEALRADARIDPARVFVLGHSLGAQMAPRVAQRSPLLAGVVLLAAPSRPLQQIYLEQIEYLAALDGDVDADERAQIEAERSKAEAIATLDPAAPAAGNLLGLPASYWIDLRGYDPVAVASALPQPMLVLQGGRDYQVTERSDFARWRTAFADDPRVQLRVFPALNHLFIAGEGVATPPEYGVAGQVAPAVPDAIAAWLQGER